MLEQPSALAFVGFEFSGNIVGREWSGANENGVGVGCVIGRDSHRSCLIWCCVVNSIELFSEPC